MDSDHSFGPLSKHCPGLAEPLSSDKTVEKDVLSGNIVPDHEKDLKQELQELQVEEETLARELEAQSLRAKVMKKRQEVER